MNKLIIYKTLFLLIFVSSCSSGEDEVQNENSSDYTIWNGGKITFTKSDDSDPTKAENQDRLTSNVWITRGINGGQIYNAAKESNADKNTSPTGTKWSVGTIDEVKTLTFNNFRTAVGSPKDVVGKNLVMYLVDDKIYLSVKFSSWGQGKGKGFSYERSTK
tara:strand:+ start:151 stop:633 length:483 start_codon:yes stop_codon:yes gene_type:complete